MRDYSASIVPASRPKTLGERLRGIAEELRQETDTQIKATSRILGAAAQMAQNHDQLIGEVVEMVEEDLDRRAPSEAIATYVVSDLKKQFKTLKAAKAHFGGVKANSWDSLAAKLNEASASPANSGSLLPDGAQDEVSKRLDAIERDIKSLQGSMGQVLELLQAIANKT